MQKCSAAQIPAVGNCLGALGGIEHKVHFAILESIDDMRSTLKHFIYFFALNSVFGQIALGATGRDDAEADILEAANRR